MTVGAGGYPGPWLLCVWVKPSCPARPPGASWAPGRSVSACPRSSGTCLQLPVACLALRWASALSPGHPLVCLEAVLRLCQKHLCCALPGPPPAQPGLLLVPCPQAGLGQPHVGPLAPELVQAWGLSRRVELLWGEPGAPTCPVQTWGAAAGLAFPA